MNKYQEALDYIIVATNGGEGMVKQINTLQELVDKATPKKPKPSGYKPSKLDKWLFGSQKTYVCPTCGNQCLVRTAPNGRNENRYCYDCGKALDWGEDDE